jgi:hypothetical protein
MSSFHIWITAPTSSYESGIIKGLVSKGYNVSAASGDIITTSYKDSPSVVIALKMDKLVVFNATELYNDVSNILLELEAKYYSIVVSEYSYESIWCCGSYDPYVLEMVRKPAPDKKLN